MTAIGPGTSNCRRFKIEDPVRDVISSIELHLSEVVLGFTIKVGQKEGSFGRTNTLDSVVYNFSPDKPLIGIYGFQGGTFINGLSFITYDISDEC